MALTDILMEKLENVDASVEKNVCKKRTYKLSIGHIMEIWGICLCIMHSYAVGKDFFDAFFANSFSEMHKITRVTRRLVLKENSATKMLYVRIHNPYFF